MTPRRTEFTAFILDLLDFMEEKIQEALENEPSRAAAIGEAALTGLDAMVAELEPLIDKVWRHCESTGNRVRPVIIVKGSGRERKE